MVCLGLKPGEAGWKAQMNPRAMAAPPDGKILFQYMASPKMKISPKIAANLPNILPNNR